MGCPVKQNGFVDIVSLMAVVVIIIVVLGWGGL